jgi:hypothetical protein
LLFKFFRKFHFPLWNLHGLLLKAIDKYDEVAFIKKAQNPVVV